MRKYAVIEKKLGETPLEALERWRAGSSLSPSIPLAYAGRLDPMATGKLLVLIGDECKHQEKYHNLDKEYEFEVLFGFSSDTYDVLGLADASSSGATPTADDIQKELHGLSGVHTFPYPHFSAKTVQGKPLHQWTLEGRLHEITIPEREMRVYTMEYLGMETVSAQELKKKIFANINSFPEVTDPKKALGKDFRRTEIRARWNELIPDASADTFVIARARATVSSGTYIRSLSAHLGTVLNTKSLAFSIHRTRMGRFLPFLRTGMWIHTYR